MESGDSFMGTDKGARLAPFNNHAATDHWNMGRIGWNIVTSSLKLAANNHGLDLRRP